MQIDMCCPRCFRRVPAPADSEMLDEVLHEAPGYALGDGETFEDMISTTLADNGPQHCPACGATLQFCEESLGQLALTMLSRM